MNLAAAAIAKNFGAASVAATTRKADSQGLLTASGVDKVQPHRVRPTQTCS